MNKKKNVYGYRNIDRLFEKNLKSLSKRYAFIRKQDIRFWKVVFVFAFIAGLTGATAWMYSNSTKDSSRESTLTRPLPNSSSAATPRVINFSGYNWEVVSSGGAYVGPGKNIYSDSEQNVFIDSIGRLHLKMTQLNGKWNCPEAYLLNSLGYGTYRYYIANPVDQYDKNIVVGLFNYESDTREIDMEFARWGNPTFPVGQYSVQPGAKSTNNTMYEMTLNSSPSVHSFQWTPASVYFQSWMGTSSTPGQMLGSWLYSGSDNPPAAGAEHAQINLWLFDANGDGIGDAPSDGKEAEMIISKFEFIPYSGQADTVAPTVSITSPANGAIFARRSTITETASASDNIAVTKTEFYVDGVLKCSDSAAPFSCSWKTSNAKKSYKLEAKAYDAQNNVGTSPLVYVTTK